LPACLLPNSPAHPCIPYTTKEQRLPAHKQPPMPQPSQQRSTAPIAATGPASPDSSIHDDDRYSRQILFPGIGAQGQSQLASAHVAIVGVGATGAAAASLLARAGVGSLTLIDRDFVEPSNLQRQILFDTSPILSPPTFTSSLAPPTSSSTPPTTSRPATSSTTTPSSNPSPGSTPPPSAPTPPP
jgi:hypothetical protein